MENSKISKTGALDYSDNDLKMELATFADGSRIIPRITIQSGRKYVAWKDNNNSVYQDYPTKILELYTNSSLHHSIIDMKAEQIAGGGLELVDTGHTKAQATIDFLAKDNQFDYNCNEVNSRIALDLVLFNGFNTQFTFLKDWSVIDEIIHVERNKVRVQTPDSDGNIFGYYTAFDWSLYRPIQLKYIEKYNFNIANERASQYKEIIKRIMAENKNVDTAMLKNFVASGNTMMYQYSKYQPNSFYYPTPDYIAAVPAIETDILSDIYAQSSLVNGMDNGIMIVIEGEADDKEAQKSAKRILKSYSGARKAGKPVIIITPDLESAPKITDIGNSNGLAQKYRTINDSVQQKLLSGHRLPNSAMVGIAVAGKLGGSSDGTDAEEIFFNKYVQPRQLILEKYWNKVMTMNNLAPVRIINNNIFNEAAIETKDNKDVVEKEDNIEINEKGKE